MKAYSRTRGIATVSLLALSALSLGTLGAGAAGLGEITITPSTGLTDGQTVQVAGSAFQANRDLRIVECGPISQARPPVFAICSNYSVEVTSDGSGSFSPQNFVVSTTIVGARRVHGHNQPATYDCLVANDCHLHVFAPVKGLASANADISFGP